MVTGFDASGYRRIGNALAHISAMLRWPPPAGLRPGDEGSRAAARPRPLTVFGSHHARRWTDYAGPAIFVEVNGDEFESPPPAAPLARPDVPVGDPREGQPELPGRWTPEDDKRLLAAYRAGHNVDQLARIFRCRPGAIDLRLRTLALVLARRNRYRY